MCPEKHVCIGGFLTSYLDDNVYQTPYMTTEYHSDTQTAEVGQASIYSLIFGCRK